MSRMRPGIALSGRQLQLMGALAAVVVEAEVEVEAEVVATRMQGFAYLRAVSWIMVPSSVLLSSASSSKYKSSARLR